MIESAIGLTAGGLAVLDQVRGVLSEMGYRRIVREVVQDFALRSGLPSSDKEAILERLDTSDSLCHELYLAATEPEFVDVLRRMGVIDTDARSESEEFLIRSLQSARFRVGASPQAKIVLEAIEGVPNKVTEQVRELFLQDNASMTLLAPGWRDVFDEPVNLHEGNLKVVTEGLGFPLLTPWSERLERATSQYRSIQEHNDMMTNYEVLISEAREGNSDVPLDIALENAVVLAAEGESRTALERLRPLESLVTAEGDERRAVFYRLVGALRLELGETREAQLSYGRAEAAVSHLGQSDGVPHVKRWLERQVRFDLLEFEDPFSSQLFDGHQQMLEVSAWHSHPAIDESARIFSGLLSREHFERAVKRDGSFRSSSLLQEALLEFNKSLILAYLTGSGNVVRDLRSQFGAGLAAFIDSDLPDTGVRIAVLELVRSRKSEAVKRLLDSYGDRVANVLDWDAMVLELRALDDIGRTVDDVHQTALAIAETMAPYLSDECAQSLSDEFAKRTIAYLQSGTDPMIRGRTFREVYFIRAFESVGRLRPDQVMGLVVGLRAHESESPFSFWSLLAAHHWTEADHEAAEAVFRQVVSGSESAVGATHNIVATLWKVGRAFPAYVDAIDEWLVARAEDDRHLLVLPYLVERYHEAAVPHIDTKSRSR